MSVRNIVIAAAVAAGVAAPSAQASIGAELAAGDRVERKLTRSYPGYDFLAVCDQYRARRFWCDFSGTKGDCFRTGHARVIGKRVRIASMTKDCF